MTRMNLEDIMPSEISITKRRILYDSTYTRYLRTAKSTATNRRYQRPQGGRNGELQLNGYSVSEWDDEKVLDMDSGRAARYCEHA